MFARFTIVASLQCTRIKGNKKIELKAGMRLLVICTILSNVEMTLGFGYCVWSGTSSMAVRRTQASVHWRDSSDL